MLAGTLASARRVFHLADAAPRVRDPAAPLPLPKEATMVLDRVSLSYAGAAVPAVRDIDLTLAPGRRTLVVGPSGSGKSSLVNLILRFEPPETGRITIGGVPVERLKAADLRRRIVAVPQHVHLFTATVAENLRLADPGATPGDLEAVCRVAQIHDFLAAQPAGYDTYAGAAGLKLSGGQVRRLAVARALLKDAPIMILDEPTEGMDRETAAALMHALLEATRDKALLVISHQPTALDRFDEIIVLEAGRVVRRGRVDTLLDAGAIAGTLPASIRE